MCRRRKGGRCTKGTAGMLYINGCTLMYKHVHKSMTHLFCMLFVVFLCVAILTDGSYVELIFFYNIYFCI